MSGRIHLEEAGTFSSAQTRLHACEVMEFIMWHNELLSYLFTNSRYSLNALVWRRYTVQAHVSFLCQGHWHTVFWVNCFTLHLTVTMLRQLNATSWCWRSKVIHMLHIHTWAPFPALKYQSGLFQTCSAALRSCSSVTITHARFNVPLEWRRPREKSLADSSQES